MTLISGTTGTDTLIGTSGDDTLQPYSTGDVDLLQGLDGADVYDLRRSGTSMLYNFQIDDGGTDGAANTIIGVGGLTQSASFGYSGYATAIRVGDDLVIHTPHRPYRFRKPARPAYDIEIVDQFGDGHITSIEAGGIVYNLSTNLIGSETADLMAGADSSEVMSTGAGDDWVFGNGGHDAMDVGTGNDTVFGGTGNDTITAADGNNVIFAEGGRDRITTGAGADRIDAGSGRDRVWAGDGNDSVIGGAGNDTLRGQSGEDTLDGGLGNDTLIGGGGNDLLRGGAGDNRMIGGKGGDTYEFSIDDGGDLTIRDNGNAPLAGAFATARDDVLVIDGFASIQDGMRGTSISINGDDLVLNLEDASSGTLLTSQITIENHFAGARFAMERIAFNGVNLGYDFNIVALEGDQNTFSIHSGTDIGGNDIVLGTSGADILCGGINNNIYLGGAGADTFVFEDQEDNRGGLDLILDFDVSEDVLDFTEIKTLTFGGLTITETADGNALIASIYETIELVGVGAATVTEDMFTFFA